MSYTGGKGGASAAMNNNGVLGGASTAMNNNGGLGPSQDLPSIHEYRDYAPPGDYALGGKIMLSAIVILFVVVMFVLLLQLYFRWYFYRYRRSRRFLRRNRHNRRTHIVFYFDNSVPASARGLDPSILNALPVFTYSKSNELDAPECAVCLSEFEEGESGRLLPKCKHSFHAACIDMWFHSHSTCPLCRSPVEAVGVRSPEEPEEISVSFSDTERFDTATSGLCDRCIHEEGQAGRAVGSSSGSSGKPSELVGVSIEIPRRVPGEFGDELGGDSPSTPFKSPLSRMLSLRRILSRERRGLSPAQSPRSGSVAAVGEEVDIEHGRGETQRSLS